jgi:hypothetical protein
MISPACIGARRDVHGDLATEPEACAEAEVVTAPEAAGVIPVRMPDEVRERLRARLAETPAASPTTPNSQP